MESQGDPRAGQLPTIPVPDNIHEHKTPLPQTAVTFHAVLVPFLGVLRKHRGTEVAPGQGSPRMGQEWNSQSDQGDHKPTLGTYEGETEADFSSQSENNSKIFLDMWTEIKQEIWDSIHLCF